MLTEVLHLGVAKVNDSRHEAQVQQLIQALPKRLRRQRQSFLRRNPDAVELCSLHRPLNISVIGDILNLVRREVTRNFRQLDAYPELIPPIEADILVRLRALKGMWTKPEKNMTVAPHAWECQTDSCAACILARIAVDKDTIRNLRVVLQSRTRTRQRHRPRSLMPFVDECINRFCVEDAEELFGTASNLAYGVKAVRKACVKAWVHDQNQKHSGHSNHRTREGIAAPSSSHHHQQRSKSSNSSHMSGLAMRSAKKTPTNSEIAQRSAASSQYSTHFSRRTVAGARKGLENDCDDPSQQIDELIDLYQGLGRGNPYAHDTLASEQMVAPAETRKESRHFKGSNSALPRTKEGDMPYRVINGAVHRNSELSRELHGSISRPHQPGQGEENKQIRKGSIKVPLMYRCSPLEYDGSGWTDYDTEYSDDTNDDLADEPRSSAMTTWSLVCDQHNFI